MRCPRLVSVAVLSLVACGDDGGSSSPDAPDVTVDAAIDAPQVIPGCDYVELNDSGNDDFSGGGPEETAITFAGTNTLCGRIDPGHFEAGGKGEPGVPDIDSFAITLSAPSDVLVTLTGAGIESLGLVELDVYGGDNFEDFIISADFIGNHAVASINLPAGRYELMMLSENATAVTTAIAYKIGINSDTPTARCPKLTTAATYTEAQDTGTSRGNDVISINYSADPVQALTAVTSDAPEPSGITAAAAMSYRISGSSAAIAVDGSYKDRDTFAFVTGPTANQLSVRLNWPGAIDLDWYLWEADMVPGHIARSITAVTAEPEFLTFAVKPSTSYWLWVAADAGSTLVAPTAYDLTVCATQFVP